MRDEPTGEQLLDTARSLLRDELLPALPADKRHAALMIANAMSIAMRQLQQGEAGERKEIEVLGALLGEPGSVAAAAGAGDLRGQLKALNREFARRIRAGEADAGPWRRAARAHLEEAIHRKVLESNPKYLGGRAG